MTNRQLNRQKKRLYLHTNNDTTMCFAFDVNGTKIASGTVSQCINIHQDILPSMSSDEVHYTLLTERIWLLLLH